MMFPIQAIALGFGLLSGPALAGGAHHHRGGAASLQIDNDIHTSITVYVDGDYIGRVSGRREATLRVPAGTRRVRLIQPSRDCVLSADVLDLPRGSTVFYEVDRSCDSASWSARFSWDRHDRWRNTWFHWRPAGFTVVHDPRDYRVHRHHGVVRTPVVRSRGGHHARGHGSHEHRRDCGHGSHHRGRSWHDDDDSSDDHRHGGRGNRDRWDDDDDSSSEDERYRRRGDRDQSHDRDQSRDRDRSGRPSGGRR